MEKEKLKEIVENTISGEWGTEEKKDENDIFVIRTADFFNDGRINYNNVIKRNIAKRKIEEKSLKIGDIIVEKSGGTDKNPVGRVVLFERENYKGLANNFTQVLRIKKEYYYKFIFYQLLYKYKNGSTLQMFNKTTGIQNLQMKLYLNQELNVCDKKEQIKISNLLDKVQEIIDISEKQVEHLDELIKSQFVEMFENENKYVNLEDVCVFINGDRGKNYPSADKISKDPSGIPFINAGLLINNTVDWKNMNYISEDTYNKLGSGKIQKEDILYCLRGSLGKHSIIDFDGKGAIASSLVILRADKSKIQPDFLLIQLGMDEILRQQNQANNGSSQPNLSAGSVKKYIIKLPSLELQNKFAEFVKQVDKQKFEIQKSLNEMKELQESLMNKYFG